MTNDEERDDGRSDRLHTFSREDLEERVRSYRDQVAHQKQSLIRLAEHADNYLYAQEAAAEQLAAYEAGREVYDPAEAEGRMTLTPGQLWHKLLSMKGEERLLTLGASLRNARVARECFEMDHAGQIESLHQAISGAEEALGLAVGLEGTDYALNQLIAAAHALRTIVDRAQGETALGPVESVVALPEFLGDRDAKARIGEQLKAAGIDPSAVCGYTWEGPSTDGCDQGVHRCELRNPLHAQDHACDERYCGQTLSHVEAEKLAEANQ